MVSDVAIVLDLAPMRLITLTDATGIRVASHPRSSVRNQHTTIPEQMPSSHRRYAEWTPQRMTRGAAKIGPATIALVETIMKAKPIPSRAPDRVWALCAW